MVHCCRLNVVQLERQLSRRVIADFRPNAFIDDLALGWELSAIKLPLPVSQLSTICLASVALSLYKAITEKALENEKASGGSP